MIYFIRGKESGNIKIGFSTSPKKRKSTLHSAHYEELEFMGIMRGSLDDEAEIKERFSKSNIRGEWYRPSSEVMDFVKENASKPNKNIVYSIGDGEYRITFSQPIKATTNFLFLVGSHKIRVLTDKEIELVFGVEGKKEILLSWLASLGVVTKQATDEFAASVTD